MARFLKRYTYNYGGQGYAGEDETSAILYYNEELVQMEKAMKNPNKQLIPVRSMQQGKTIFQDALTGDATLATLEKGERIFKLLEEKIIERIETMQQGKYYEEVK